MEFFFQLFVKEGIHFMAFIMRPVLCKPFGHSPADAVHEKPHFGSIVHIQDIIEPQLGTADDAVEGGKGGVVIKHETPPGKGNIIISNIVLSFCHRYNV